MLTFILDGPDEIENFIVPAMLVLSKPVHSHRQCTSRTRAATDEQDVVEVCSRWHVTVWSFYRRPSHGLGILKGQVMQLLCEAVLCSDDELCRIVRDQREGMGLEATDTWDPQEGVGAWLSLDGAV